MSGSSRRDPREMTAFVPLAAAAAAPVTSQFLVAVEEAAPVAEAMAREELGQVEEISGQVPPAVPSTTIPEDLRAAIRQILREELTGGWPIIHFVKKVHDNELRSRKNKDRADLAEQEIKALKERISNLEELNRGYEERLVALEGSSDKGLQELPAQSSEPLITRAELKLEGERASRTKIEESIQSQIRALEEQEKARFELRSPPVPSAEEIIAEYKNSDEFGDIMVGFGEHAVTVLKKALVKDEKIDPATAELYTYENCTERVLNGEFL